MILKCCAVCGTKLRSDNKTGHCHKHRGSSPHALAAGRAWKKANGWPDSPAYIQNAKKVAAIKVARGCADCGYNDNPVALHFDHLPGFKKVKQISRLLRCRWETIEREIAKCEVVCANCHAIRTANRQREKISG
jgi:hypothetical protein